jgi:hypothetical protein
MYLSIFQTGKMCGAHHMESYHAAARLGIKLRRSSSAVLVPLHKVPAIIREVRPSFLRSK